MMMIAERMMMRNVTWRTMIGQKEFGEVIEWVYGKDERGGGGSGRW